MFSYHQIKEHQFKRFYTHVLFGLFWSNFKKNFKGFEDKISIREDTWKSTIVLGIFKRQPYKMVKHTQTIRRQQPDHSVGLALNGLSKLKHNNEILFSLKSLENNNFLKILWKTEVN